MMNTRPDEILKPHSGHPAHDFHCCSLSLCNLILPKVFMNSFFKSQFPNKSVNLSFIITFVKRLYEHFFELKIVCEERLWSRALSVLSRPCTESPASAHFQRATLTGDSTVLVLYVNDNR